MKPGARIQTAIELVGQIMSPPPGREAVPADTLLSGYFRGRRYIGSKDRRAISDLVYTMLRNRARIGAAMEGDPDPRRGAIITLAHILDWPADDIRAAFDGSQYCPAPLAEDLEAGLLDDAVRTRLAEAGQADRVGIRANIPDWLAAPMAGAFEGCLEQELDALQTIPPVDLRVNTLKAPQEGRSAVRAELAAAGIEAGETPNSPWGLRLEGRYPLQSLPAYRDGRIEVQDEGSQIAALVAGAEPDEAVLDYCAGAGGKTLAIAAMMQNRGRLVAADSVAGRLRPLVRRAERAGASIIESHVLGESTPLAGDAFDRVVVDAPCSGSGAWRRHPEAPWRLTEERLAELVRLQAEILAKGAQHVRPGGWLVYITCSVLPRENQQQVAAFLAGHPHFRQQDSADIWRQTLPTLPPMSGACEANAPSPEAPGVLLTPRRTGTDGFFVAHLQRAP